MELASTRVVLSNFSVGSSNIGISRKFPQSALRPPEEALWGVPTSGQGPGTSDPGVTSGATRDAAWLCRVLENTGENQGVRRGRHEAEPQLCGVSPAVGGQDIVGTVPWVV